MFRISKHLTISSTPLIVHVMASHSLLSLTSNSTDMHRSCHERRDMSMVRPCALLHRLSISSQLFLRQAQEVHQHIREARCSQARNRIPAHRRVEASCIASGITATRNVIEDACIGIQSGVDETDRRLISIKAFLVDERKDAGKGWCRCRGAAFGCKIACKLYGLGSACFVFHVLDFKYLLHPPLSGKTTHWRKRQDILVIVRWC